MAKEIIKLCIENFMIGFICQYKERVHTVCIEVKLNLLFNKQYNFKHPLSGLDKKLLDSCDFIVLSIFEKKVYYYGDSNMWNISQTASIAYTKII